MADFEPKTWTAGATAENVIHAADCYRWQAGIAEAGGRWDGEWEDDDTTGLGNITADQLSALETEIHKLASTFEIKAVSDGVIPGIDEWNRIEQGIVRAISGHVWNITWQWSDDYATCMAVFEDADTGDTETVECVIASVVTAPTCTEQGYTTFTATATLDGIDYTDIVIGDYVPATGHQWGEPEWDWAEDYTFCQAVFTCEICGDKDTVDCTVTETAEGGYTATCTHDGTEYSDTVGPQVWIAFAVYTTDNSLIFGAGSEVPAVGGTYLGETVTEVYTGFETETWQGEGESPWNDYCWDIRAVTIDASFKHIQPVSTAYWFCMIANENGTAWLGLENIDTSEVTTMRSMFMYSGNEDAPYGLSDLSGLKEWDTSKVTDMNNMFNGCSAITEIDVSSWDTSKVTDMGYMFRECSGLTTLDVSSWDTSKVTDMNNMFNGCLAITEIDVSSWDTSKVTDMGYMFRECSGLSTLDVSNFNTSSVTSMADMFYGCSGLTTINVSNFDTSKVTTMTYMFYGCSGLTTIDLSNFNTSKVTNMSNMFRGCSGLTTLDVSNFNTSSVTNMSYMFYRCSGLTTIYSDDSNFVTTKVTSGGSMFTSCSKLVGGNGTAYSSSNVTYTMAHVDTADNPGYFTQR